MISQKQIHISDTIHGTIKLNSLEKEVISTQIFNRLHNISQNSTVYLTFPTNRTKRFEHSIGTMLICGNILQESITNSDAETIKNLFKNVQEIIDNQIINHLDKYSTKYRSKIGDRNLSDNKLLEYKKLEIPQEYNAFIPINIPNEYISTYLLLFQAVRLCGLLHDVGHPPYSHITEYALKNIWNNIKKIDKKDLTPRQCNFLSCLERYFLTDQDLHEQIGNKIVEKVLDDIVIALPPSKERDNAYINQQLFKILVAEITSAILQEKNTLFSELHRIIDGTLDGDRLDYVSRDPINSGLNVGMIEYDRIISGMKCTQEGNCFIFTPSSKVIDSIDDFFNRRWRMYKQIIYHHRVIKTDFLLQECIEELAMIYLKSTDEDDKCDNILPYNISGLWKAIEDKVSHKAFFDRLIQWDDGWLMTILKVHYFKEYANVPEPSYLCYKLEELLANKKNYYSLIKRMEDFIVIDEEIAKIFFELNDTIKDAISETIENNDNIDENLDYVKNEIIVPLDPVLNIIKFFLEEVSTSNGTYKSLAKNGFFLSKIDKVFSNILEANWLNYIIDESVKEIVKFNKDIKDAFPVRKKIKTGLTGSKTCITGGLGVYSTNIGSINTIDFVDISNISDILQADVDSMPVFYMYLLKNIEDVRYHDIKVSLGKCIADKIIKVVVSRLNELK